MILASAGTVLMSTLILFVSFLLICLILLQKNRGSGLSGAFGGAGGQSAFGTKTGDVLTWTTVGLTSLFLLLCVAATWVFTPETVVPPTPPPGSEQPAQPATRPTTTAKATSTRPSRVVPITAPSRPGATPAPSRGTVPPAAPKPIPAPASAPAAGS